MKIYISGPMSGLHDYNRTAFNNVAKYLRDLGYEVVNPAELNETNVSPFTWHELIKVGVRQLTTCDLIVLLPGYDKSRGALIEYRLAQEVNIPAIHTNELPFASGELAKVIINRVMADKGRNHSQRGTPE